MGFVYARSCKPFQCLLHDSNFHLLARAVTYFTDDPAGDARFDYFKQVVRVEKLDRILAPFTDDLNGVAVALITFFYVDFLDTSVCTGTADEILVTKLLYLTQCRIFLAGYSVCACQFAWLR